MGAAQISSSRKYLLTVLGAIWTACQPNPRLSVEVAGCWERVADLCIILPNKNLTFWLPLPPDRLKLSVTATVVATLLCGG